MLIVVSGLSGGWGGVAIRAVVLRMADGRFIDGRRGLSGPVHPHGGGSRYSADLNS